MRKISLSVLVVSVMFFVVGVPRASAQYDFDVYVTPQAIPISQGGVTSFEVVISSKTYDQFYISVYGLPSGITSTSDTSGMVSTGKPLIELHAAVNASTGSFPITVAVTEAVTGGNHTKRQPLTLNVLPSSLSMQQSGPNMAAWEYTTVTAPSTQQFVSVSNQLGSQLWELVSVIQVPLNSQQQWVGFFKRLKQ